MDVSLLIRQRLQKLGLEQKDLARAARVTESYVSQLVTGKRAPPSPARSDIYERMEKLLRLPAGELARLADLERREELKRELAVEPVPAPLLGHLRDLVLRKCDPDTERYVRAIFEKEPFGELERLVTQKLLDVVKDVAREEKDNEAWLRTVAHLGGRSFGAMRAFVREFLAADVFHISTQDCASFLDPLIESWNINFATFGMEIVLHHRVAAEPVRKFEFTEQDAGPGGAEEPGFIEFTRDPSLSGSATEQELDFLRRLRFRDRRPTSLYYYRELQSLRDPLHFKTLPA